MTHNDITTEVNRARAAERAIEQDRYTRSRIVAALDVLAHLEPAERPEHEVADLLIIAAGRLTDALASMDAADLDRRIANGWAGA